MYFRDRKINGKKYKYAVRSARLPDGNPISLEKIYKNEKKEELDKFFLEKEKIESFKFMIKRFGTDHIFDEHNIKVIEDIRIDYKRIMRNLSKLNINDLLDRFTANFTYESNALEGNSLTLKDVAIVMIENTSLKGKDLREIYETINSREVVGLLMKNKFSISEKDIIKMHKMLVKDIEVKTGYKEVPNFLLNRDVETVLPENVEKEMKNLIDWYNKNKDKIHPLKIASLFHGKFEKIHPFEDGNGRVGRFLINVILIKNKYPPLIVRKTHRISYLNALEDFDKKHEDTLIRFMLERFKETYRKFFEIYVKYINVKT